MISRRGYTNRDGRAGTVRDERASQVDDSSPDTVRGSLHHTCLGDGNRSSNASYRLGGCSSSSGFARG
jgi:hypothetical protein